MRPLQHSCKAICELVPWETPAVNRSAIVGLYANLTADDGACSSSRFNVALWNRLFNYVVKATASRMHARAAHTRWVPLALTLLSPSSTSSSCHHHHHDVYLSKLHRRYKVIIQETIMAAVCSRCGHYFSSCGFISSSFFLSIKFRSLLTELFEEKKHIMSQKKAYCRMCVIEDTKHWHRCCQL